MSINYIAHDIIQKLNCFCLLRGFKDCGNNDDILSNSDSTLNVQRGTVRIYADSFCNRFKLTTSTGISESCALTDLKIEDGILIINGREFIV